MRRLEPPPSGNHRRYARPESPRCPGHDVHWIIKPIYQPIGRGKCALASDCGWSARSQLGIHDTIIDLKRAGPRQHRTDVSRAQIRRQTQRYGSTRAGTRWQSRSIWFAPSPGRRSDQPHELTSRAPGHPRGSGRLRDGVMGNRCTSTVVCDKVYREPQQGSAYARGQVPASLHDYRHRDATPRCRRRSRRHTPHRPHQSAVMCE